MGDGWGDGPQLVVRIGEENWTLDPGTRTVVGRSSGCDISVDNSHISREHLAFEFDGTRWTGTDLGTANGTFVEGSPAAQFDIEGLTIVVIGGASGEVASLDIIGGGDGAPPAPMPVDEEATVVGTGSTPPAFDGLAEPPKLAELPPLDPPSSPSEVVVADLKVPSADITLDEVLPPPGEPVDLPAPDIDAPAADISVPAAALPAEPPPPAGPPAGWYPDPDDTTQERYWDGTAWADDYRSTETADAPPSDPPVDVAPPDPDAPPVGSPVDLPPPDTDAPPTGGPVDLPPPAESGPVDLPPPEQDGDFRTDPPPAASERVDDVPPPPGYRGPDDSDEQPTSTPADWYPDPHDASRWRYWDGEAWTDHYSPPAG